MVNRFLSTTFFAFILFFNTTPFATLVAPKDTRPVIKETGNSIIWVVEEGETLSSIAEAYYGETSYWTTIWNDNSWIENPFLIEKEWTLELRSRVPNELQALDSDLMKRLSKTEYYYSPEVQDHPAMGTIKITKIPSVNPNVQSITAEVVPPVQPQAVTYNGGPLTEAQITYLGQCEAGMDPAKNTGNGYYGAFQFSHGTWRSMNTGYERADMAPLHVQKDAVQRLVQRSSIHTQFPGCARKMRTLGML